ncbi:MAG: hypothetical protein ACI4XM_02375 [Candidatus Coprovivens sp.]
MKDNNENNNDNLFTQMFGIESEQQTPPITKEEPIMQENPFQTLDSSEQHPNIKEEQNTLEDNKSIQSLNQNNPNKPNNEPDIITLTSTPKEEPNTIKEQPPQENIIPKFDSNAIPTNQYNQYSDNNQLDNDDISTNGTGLKISLVLIGIIVLSFGWLYFYNFVLNPSTENPNQQLEKNSSTDEKEDEETEEPIVINFSQNLSFYKGLVDDENELNQETPYEPAAKTGVIKCELIEPLKDSSLTTNTITYLYYEKNLLKKSYMQQMINISDKNTFTTLANYYKELESQYTNTENFTLDIQIDYISQTITVGIFSNLAYGSYVKSPIEGMNLQIKLNYNDTIKKSMGVLLGAEETLGNVKCSSVKTS